MVLTIQKNVSLFPYNTFQIDVKAKYFVEISTIEELQELFATEIFKQEKKLILGGGANVLFTGDVEGLVIRMGIKGKKVENKKGNQIFVRVAAGENWSDFVEYANEQERAGIENLIAIPGSVGAAPVSNIGAYGMEIGNRVVWVEGYDLQTCTFRKFSHEECRFSYRSSIFKFDLKNQFLVTHVVFVLEAGDENYQFITQYPDIQQCLVWDDQPLTLVRMSEIITRIREQKLPDRKKIWTAGSFFANPIVSSENLGSLLQEYPQLISYPYGEQYKLSAGQLIDLVGLKGYSNGRAGTYERHALIVINEWGGAKDVLEVVEYIQDQVFAKFGVRLVPEVVMVD